MTPFAAALDVALAVAAFIAAHLVLFLSGLFDFLVGRFPSMGIFFANAWPGLSMVVFVVLVLTARNQTAAFVGLRRPRPIAVLAWTIPTVLACYVMMLIAVPSYLLVSGTDVQGMIEERSAFFEELPVLPAWGAILFAMFVGVHEELLFRGFILARLRALFRSTSAAVAVTTAIFGALHASQGPIGIVQTGSVGLVLAVGAVRARSIWPVIVAHGIFDSIGLVLIPFLQDDVFKELINQADGAASRG
jgi:membrane protease YdiL (CAAX protease family)